jgi:hypothetical protein
MGPGQLGLIGILLGLIALGAGGGAAAWAQGGGEAPVAKAAPVTELPPKPEPACSDADRELQARTLEHRQEVLRKAIAAAQEPTPGGKGGSPSGRLELLEGMYPEERMSVLVGEHRPGPELIAISREALRSAFSRPELLQEEDTRAIVGIFKGELERAERGESPPGLAQSLYSEVEPSLAALLAASGPLSAKLATGMSEILEALAPGEGSMRRRSLLRGAWLAGSGELDTRRLMSLAPAMSVLLPGALSCPDAGDPGFRQTRDIARQFVSLSDQLLPEAFRELPTAPAAGPLPAADLPAFREFCGWARNLGSVRQELKLPEPSAAEPPWGSLCNRIPGSGLISKLGALFRFPGVARSRAATPKKPVNPAVEATLKDLWQDGVPEAAGRLAALLERDAVFSDPAFAAPLLDELLDSFSTVLFFLNEGREGEELGRKLMQGIRARIERVGAGPESAPEQLTARQDLLLESIDVYIHAMDGVRSAASPMLQVLRESAFESFRAYAQGADRLSRREGEGGGTLSNLSRAVYRLGVQDPERLLREVEGDATGRGRIQDPVVRAQVLGVYAGSLIMRLPCPQLVLKRGYGVD